MDVKITPSKLSGQIDAIPSKSDAHRLLICAALADKPTKLIISKNSDDIDATVSCLVSMGAKIERSKDYIIITPIKKTEAMPHLDCMESGSTFRFLLPTAAAVYDKVSFTGRGRLPARPIGHLSDEMKRHGVSFSNDLLPFTTSGLLQSGEYVLPGNVSSQYITGLLFALPLTDGSSTIKLTTRLESSPYIDITLSALSRFGIKVERSEREFKVEGNQKFTSPDTLKVEGDWSNAAFFLVAGAIGKSISMRGLDMSSVQGDRVIIDILKRFGAKVEINGDTVTVSPAPLVGCEIDVGEAPDMLPVLCIAAACAEGETRFVNAARLRLKESDRLAACSDMLAALGIKSEVRDDSMTVFGGTLTGGHVDSVNDHRIAMSAAVAAIRASGDVYIKDAQAVNKSYPAFYEDYNKLGGCANVI